MTVSARGQCSHLESRWTLTAGLRHPGDLKFATVAMLVGDIRQGERVPRRPSWINLGSIDLAYSCQQEICSPKVLSVNCGCFAQRSSAAPQTVDAPYNGTPARSVRRGARPAVARGSGG